MNPLGNALWISGLSVRYGDRMVLSGLDLEVSGGTVMGLLGPNGAGKTTLIRTICGRVRKSAGAISIGGLPEGAKARRLIGLVPQEIALFQHLTARENLLAFGRLSGLSGSQARDAVKWAAEATGSAQRLDDRVAVLSGGWKRRVNICAAILHRPALLILDEPTVGIDLTSREGLHGTIRQLARDGMGVLMTTHDLDDAEFVCDRVGFLRMGRIEPQGDPRDLIRAAFGRSSEVVASLRSAPSPEQVRSLRSIGFRPLDSGLTWTVESPGAISSGQVTEAFARTGLQVREIRIREPGLGSLFARLAANETGGLAA
jgi:ABC-2 type transport system ATP-binding protein